MGMSMHVYGIKPPDEKWKAMKAIYDNCKLAGVPVPEKVHDFFKGIPDEDGVLVHLDYETTDVAGQPQGPIATEYHSDMADGFEIVVARIPADIKIIRFVNSF